MSKSILVSFPRILKQILEDDVFGLAAQLAYFFLLSLFPLLIFLFTLISYLPITETHLLGFIQDFAPGETIQLIETNIEDIMSGRNGKLLSLGIIGTIWSGSNGINAIVRAFNKAYNVQETRSFLLARGMSILLTLAMLFVFIVVLLLPVFGRKIGIFIFSELGLSSEFLVIWNTLRWVVSSLILLIVFLCLYWIAPNKKIKCLSVLPGAIFATVGWVLASLGFSYYVGNFGNYSAMYGSIGAIIVLLVWFYITGVIIILGGEINGFSSRLKDESCN
ncbi:YihY/virulence factor BrkB family protein [Bacillus massilinigeriensis]|uniref:YihY/virulence factor BrkB family protein n=1 Tax=Bacillus massilionigeriensis TaxID=1805475 RepID=UPI00096B45BE|nr:YihY/virulence factor BrkB family protein [Bacillus massilionigeriensis]